MNRCWGARCLAALLFETGSPGSTYKPQLQLKVELELRLASFEAENQYGSTFVCGSASL